MTTTHLIVAAALAGAVLLHLALTMYHGRLRNRLHERVGALEAYELAKDPGYWRERLGRDAAAPLANDDPEVGPPPCELHEVNGSNQCKRCGRTFRPSRAGPVAPVTGS